MTERTEADAISELSAAPIIQPISDRGLLVALPPGWNVAERSLEHLEPTPRRPRGDLTVHDAPSFAAAITDRKGTGHTTIYADESSLTFTAVLNDDHAGEAGWRDARVIYHLSRTPEWNRWSARSGEFMSQEAFATHIEDSLAELRSPTPAALLDLAQTFHATTAARFKSGRRLASGATQFVYEQDIEATAGSDGTVEIPAEIEIECSLFPGMVTGRVRAWFRFRLKGSDLSLGYKIQGAEALERDAFRTLASELLPPPVYGFPPSIYGFPPSER